MKWYQDGYIKRKMKTQENKIDILMRVTIEEERERLKALLRKYKSQ